MNSHDYAVVIVAILGAIPLTISALAAMSLRKNIGKKNGQGTVADMAGQTLKNQMEMSHQITAIALQLAEHIGHHNAPVVMLPPIGTTAPLGDDSQGPVQDEHDPDHQTDGGEGGPQDQAVRASHGGDARDEFFG